MTPLRGEVQGPVSVGSGERLVGDESDRVLSVGVVILRVTEAETVFAPDEAEHLADRLRWHAERARSCPAVVVKGGGS